MGKVANHGKWARSAPHGHAKSINKWVDKSGGQNMAWTLSDIAHTTESNFLANSKALIANFSFPEMSSYKLFVFSCHMQQTVTMLLR